MLSARKRLLGYFRRYWITPDSIWLRQSGGWVELKRNDIAALKFVFVSKLIVRFYNGRRAVVSLFGFSNPAYAAVLRALRESLQQNQQTHAVPPC
jgi:hypothetical protein